MKREMTSKERVSEVLAIWRLFLAQNGGRENLNLNIFTKWPGFLQAKDADQAKRTR